QREDTAAQFHPARAWLLAHGYNPEKAGDVEICDVRNWVAWSRQEQPSSLLHELAHAYHFRLLGENHPLIRDAYEHAMAAGFDDGLAELRLQVRILERLGDLRVQALDDLLRHARRARDAKPQRRLVARYAGFRHGGHIRELDPALWRRHRERLQSSRPHLAEHVRHAGEGDTHFAREKILHRRSTALVRHVVQLHVRHRIEERA